MTENISGANVGFEKEISVAANKLRDNIDIAEYKNMCLGQYF